MLLHFIVNIKYQEIKYLLLFIYIFVSKLVREVCPHECASVNTKFVANSNDDRFAFDVLHFRIYHFWHQRRYCPRVNTAIANTNFMYRLSSSSPTEQH